MSWDILVQDFPKDARTVEDVPDDFVPQTLMPRSDLIAKIQEIVPEADFSDPSWGTIEGPDYSLELDVGEDDAVSSFAFHVRGGDMAAGVVAAILEHLDLRAIDTGQDDDSPGFQTLLGLGTRREAAPLAVIRHASDLAQCPIAP